MRKLFSLTAFIFAFITVFAGANSEGLTDLVNRAENPDLIKFLAPIIAGLLGKLIDKLFQRRKDKEVQ